MLDLLSSVSIVNNEILQNFNNFAIWTLSIDLYVTKLIGSFAIIRWDQKRESSECNVASTGWGYFIEHKVYVLHWLFANKAANSLAFVWLLFSGFNSGLCSMYSLCLKMKFRWTSSTGQSLFLPCAKWYVVKACQSRQWCCGRARGKCSCYRSKELPSWDLMTAGVAGDSITAEVVWTP